MPSIQIDDQKLFYSWKKASDEGPALLFVHGLGSSHAFYETIIPSLVDKGVSCLSFDTPGSGLSRYRSHDSDVSAICGAALALLVEVGVDVKKTIIVGHSMGAMVATELSKQLRALGTVLIGPVNPSSNLADVFAQRIALVEKEGMEGVAAVVPSAATGSKSTPTHRAFIRALLLSQSPEGYASLCRTIAGAKKPDYAGTHCPLLIVAGSDDKTAPLAGSQDIFKSWGVGDSEKSLVVLDGVGHWHCIEAPELVEQHVSQFISKLVRE